MAFKHENKKKKNKTVAIKIKTIAKNSGNKKRMEKNKTTQKNTKKKRKNLNQRKNTKTHKNKKNKEKKNKTIQNKKKKNSLKYNLNYFKASSTATATATVAPTIGLLPIPISPIISTWAGTELDPANWASECILPKVSVIP